MCNVNDIEFQLCMASLIRLQYKIQMTLAASVPFNRKQAIYSYGWSQGRLCEMSIYGEFGTEALTSPFSSLVSKGHCLSQWRAPGEAFFDPLFEEL